MSDGPLRIHHHVAVRLGADILVFGGGTGQSHKPASLRIIWRYNRYTEQWRKDMIPECHLCPPATTGACAVAIKGDVFLFGGYIPGYKFFGITSSNALWKLCKSPGGFFTWSKVVYN